MLELTRTKALFVQPHLDDIALSCGGIVARARDRGEHPHVLTVFAGERDPDLGISEMAAELHRDWALGDNPWPARIDEDRRAMDVLGATSEQLTYCDAMYRGYDSREKLFGAIAAADHALVDRISNDV